MQSLTARGLTTREVAAQVYRTKVEVRDGQVKSRGLGACIQVCNGLEGLPDACTAVRPRPPPRPPSSARTRFEDCAAT